MAAKKHLIAAERALHGLFEEHAAWLMQYPWRWEGDRWKELLISALNGSQAIEPLSVRKTIEILDQLDLLDPNALASADGDSLALMYSIMDRNGFDRDQAEHATAVIHRLAVLVTKTWGGHAQKFLRKHAGNMRKELSKLLAGMGMSRTSADKAAVLWLQNVANLPLLLPHDAHIQSFCKKHRLSEEELIELADGCGMNLAVLDDLLAIAATQARPQRKIRKTSASR